MSSGRRRKQTQEPHETDATPINLPEEEALPLLQSGEVIGGHRMPRGSNYTFLVAIDAGPGKYLRAIYKPRDGERPLYDFPSGTLYKREYAAYLLSQIQGWPRVPLTLIRDGPYGVGSMQLYVDCDPAITYFELVENSKGSEDELQRQAVFDVLANNADRKASHCLLGQDGRIWSIDHGLTFHPIFKLRTVMLEFWGQPIPMSLLSSMEDLLKCLDSGSTRVAQLTDVIAESEIDALKRRVEAMLETPVLPKLDPYRHVPWPLE